MAKYILLFLCVVCVWRLCDALDMVWVGELASGTLTGELKSKIVAYIILLISLYLSLFFSIHSFALTLSLTFLPSLSFFLSLPLSSSLSPGNWIQPTGWLSPHINITEQLMGGFPGRPPSMCVCMDLRWGCTIMCVWFVWNKELKRKELSCESLIFSISIDTFDTTDRGDDAQIDVVDFYSYYVSSDRPAGNLCRHLIVGDRFNLTLENTTTTAPNVMRALRVWDDEAEIFYLRIDSSFQFAHFPSSFPFLSFLCNNLIFPLPHTPSLSSLPFSSP